MSMCLCKFLCKSHRTSPLGIGETAVDFTTTYDHMKKVFTWKYNIIGDIAAILKIFGLHPKCPHCVTEFAYIYHPRRPEANTGNEEST